MKVGGTLHMLNKTETRTFTLDYMHASFPVNHSCVHLDAAQERRTAPQTPELLCRDANTGGKYMGWSMQSIVKRCLIS